MTPLTMTAAIAVGGLCATGRLLQRVGLIWMPLVSYAVGLALGIAVAVEVLGVWSH